MSVSRFVLALVLLGGLTACSALRQAWELPRQWISGEAPQPEAIDAYELMRHTRVLASDQFEGRLPGTRGEDLTVDYLVDQFRAMGLEPGNPVGSYLQPVPLMGLTPSADVGISVRGQPVPVTIPRDLVANSPLSDAVVRVRDSQLVFAGYGIQAAEYGWDDFAGIDVRGKTLLVLVNDPPIPHPDQPDSLDPRFFGGEAMTYYGRWTYKYEIAARLGAAGVFVIHETGPAGYPWEVISRNPGGEHFRIYQPAREESLTAVQGWMHVDYARRLLEAAGLDYAALKAAAARPGFRAQALPAQASMQVLNRLRKVRSHNVIAKVTGTDPRRADEYVLYTAHWDHLGRDRTLAGDQIYNGAFDNATGVAGLLELAQAFAVRPPSRSVLFLAVTAEEQGLLGARYYAANPLYPLERTVANINMDGLNIWGQTRDIVVVGKGQSTLEDVLQHVARAVGRTMVAEPDPQHGYYYRSDHFELAKRGVPALYTDFGVDFVGRPPGWGVQQRAAYYATDYHKVSDEVRDDWDLAGAIADLKLMHAVGRWVAEADDWPQWKAGSEFRTIREQSLQ